MNIYKKYHCVRCMYKLSVCISKNLRWLNEQSKRVLRYDTRSVSRLYDFQVWLQCWRYHYHLLICLCHRFYDTSKMSKLYSIPRCVNPSQTDSFRPTENKDPSFMVPGLMCQALDTISVLGLSSRAWQAWSVVLGTTHMMGPGSQVSNLSKSLRVLGFRYTLLKYNQTFRDTVY